MRSSFFSHLVNGPFGDPALYVRIAHRGDALLFDCGDLHPLTTRDLFKIRALFISHGHIDHLVGFDQLLRTRLCGNDTLHVCGPGGFLELMRQRLQGYTWNLTRGYSFSIRVRELTDEGWQEQEFSAARRFQPGPLATGKSDSGELFSTPHYRVRAVPLQHGDIACLAFSLEETLHVAIHKEALQEHGLEPGAWLTHFKERIRAGAEDNEPIVARLSNGEVKTLPMGELRNQIAHCERGMKVVYVTDAEPSPNNLTRIEDLARDAHLLAIEATFPHSELERARQRNHLTARLAGEVAHRAGAGRLLVFHHSPRHRLPAGALEQEAQQAFKGTLE